MQAKQQQEQQQEEFLLRQQHARVPMPASIGSQHLHRSCLLLLCTAICISVWPGRPVTDARPHLLLPVCPHFQKFTPENVEFQAKILARSGLGEDTYLPPGLQQQPPATSMEDARWEFQQVCLFGVGRAQ